MNIPLIHPWKVSPREAIRIQEELRKKLRLRTPTTPLKKIAAGDVSYSRLDDRTYAAFLLFTYPDLTLLERASAKGHASFPYIPGLLTFREGPVLLQAFSRLAARPDLILIDGQGIAHPRAMGIAAHIGLILNLPSIGCAKSRLIGTHKEPALDRGQAVPLLVGDRTAGMVLRTRNGVKPVYVSPGHKMDMDTSLRIVLSLCRGYRIPEPLRQVHIFVNHLRGTEES
jgi:deoxyribonuclease V